MKTVICSHGFGVRADSRGMFTEIAGALSGATFVLFDYTDSDGRGGTYVPSLTEQAKRLQRTIDTHKGEDITLLCHSQGCMIAGMVDVSTVSKVILLAPPTGTIMQRLLERIAARPGSYKDGTGAYHLVRSDGTMTTIDKAYMDEIATVHPEWLYARIAESVPTVLVRATEDDVLGKTRLGHLAGAQRYEIAADHNFTGSARPKLIALLKDLIKG
ncbi:alpha/beta fold hydrolase [Candidatus Saccharibacteria bacterium]|nr:MAG: alpha/beta fold hydrolase [Candidatus Saccharibacteria bacterium]